MYWEPVGYRPQDKGLQAWAGGGSSPTTLADQGGFGRLQCVDKILKDGKRDPRKKGWTYSWEVGNSPSVQGGEWYLAGVVRSAGGGGFRDHKSAKVGLYLVKSLSRVA